MKIPSTLIVNIGIGGCVVGKNEKYVVMSIYGRETVMGYFVLSNQISLKQNSVFA